MSNFWKDFEDWYDFVEEHGFKAEMILPREHELHTIYPEAKATVIRLLKEYVKEEKVMIKEDKRKAFECGDYKNIDGMEGFYEGTKRRRKIRENIERLQKFKSKYEFKVTGHKQIDVNDVKHIPITDYLDFNRDGKRLCIWHNEKTPSLKFYPQGNRVKCFGCDKGGDIIDVVMQDRGCSFVEALNILAK